MNQPLRMSHAPFTDEFGEPVHQPDPAAETGTTEEERECD